MWVSSQTLIKTALTGDPVVKNPPSSAGDTGSIPGRGIKIPYAMGQLSPYTSQLVSSWPQQRASAAKNPDFIKITKNIMPNPVLLLVGWCVHP